MKQHAIIPIFIPHLGCPHDCVFCNQKQMTHQETPVTPDGVPAILEAHLSTLEGRKIKTVEAAFYGGSFTGLPFELQSAYLSQLKPFKEEGRIQKIHLSTRPDLIDEEILSNLLDWGVDVIELGVQSFDEKVLALSRRGHSRESIYRSARLIQDAGFTLGIQLMIGLPGDTRDTSVESARQTAVIKPALARIYPTIVLPETELEQQYLSGFYQPPTLSQAVETARDMHLILLSAGVQVIRAGLKDDYHPAFHQLVQSEMAKVQLEQQLRELLPSGPSCTVTFFANRKCFSNLSGHQKSNRTYFQTNYPGLRFRYQEDQALPDDRYRVILLPAGV